MNRQVFAGIIWLSLTSLSLAQTSSQWQRTDPDRTATSPSTSPSLGRSSTDISSGSNMRNYELGSQPRSTSPQTRPNSQWRQPGTQPYSSYPPYSPGTSQPPVQWNPQSQQSQQPQPEPQRPDVPLYDPVFEWRPLYNLYSASGDLYGDGSGLESQFIYWAYTHLGIGFIVGYENWSIDETRVVTFSDPSGESGVRFSGDATIIPIGLSAFYRAEFFKRLQLTVETGVRYLLSDVSMDFSEYSTLVIPPSEVPVNGNVSADDSILGRIGATLGWRFTDYFTAFIGVGYQIDITGGDVNITVFDDVGGSVQLQRTVESDMSGLFISIGAGIGM